MATVSIPLPSPDQPYTLQSTSLEGRSYQFIFNWNSRKDRWSMSIFNEDGTAILSGALLCIGIDLLNTIPWTLPNVPPGFLFLGGTADPTLNTIEDVSLLYIESTDSPARA